MTKEEELRSRVGNSETHYCGGKCKRKTEHRLKEWAESGIVWRTYHFTLICKECGKEDEIYSCRH